jgi:signal transduction histidine kinase
MASRLAAPGVLGRHRWSGIPLRRSAYVGYAGGRVTRRPGPATVGRVESRTQRAGRVLLEAWPSLALLVFGLIATAPAGENQPHTARPPDLAGYVLVAIAALALAPRRRLSSTLAVNGAAVAIYLAAGYPYGPILFTIPVTIFRVAAQWPARRAFAAVAVYFGVILAAAVVKEWRGPAGLQGDQLLWLSVAWSAVAAAALAVGVSVKVRREAAAGVRAEQARRAVSEERLQMAQDLHDTVGHGLAVIAMQAGVALHVLDRDLEQARKSMQAVRSTSRESLESLRAELDALRSPDAVGARRPAPGLDDVGRLAERVSAGGVAVDVDIDPGLRAVPPAVDAVAYRILRESLTNVLRHAGAATARIRVRDEGGLLLLDVTDTGRGATSAGLGDGAGTGIRGMRAQAETLGGTLDAGPRPGGGFAVTARLPLPGSVDGSDR